MLSKCKTTLPWECGRNWLRRLLGERLRFWRSSYLAGWMKRWERRRTRLGSFASCLSGGRRWRLRVDRNRVENLVLALSACSAYNMCMQYTIRNVPEYLDAALRVKAREQGKSLNEVTVEALARGFGLCDSRVRQRDMSDIAGSWKRDPAFDRAIAEQDTVDEEMWR